jgi:hypothetical protein
MADLLPPRPTAGYWFAQLPIPVRTQCYKEIARILETRFRYVKKATRDAAGLEIAPPKDRLDWYTRKPPEMWAEQQAKYPRSYEQNMKDFGRLVAREADGDFEDEEETA